MEREALKRWGKEAAKGVLIVALTWSLGYVVGLGVGHGLSVAGGVVKIHVNGAK